MSKRRILLLASVAVIAAVVGAVVFSITRTSRPVASPTPSAAGQQATPTPQMTAPSSVSLVKDEEAYLNRNPVFGRLPYSTRWWRIAFDSEGSAPNVLPLVVAVYVTPESNVDEAIAKQKPYVEQWISSHGQQPGTYQVRYTSEVPDTY